jgi:hypothetical protein
MAMPSSTFRAWVVGLIWEVLFPGVNQFFYFRYPLDRFVIKIPHGVSISLLRSKLLKRGKRRLAFPHVVESLNLQGLGSLPATNPGPFTVMRVTAYVGAGPAYAVSIAPTPYRQHPDLPVAA